MRSKDSSTSAATLPPTAGRVRLGERPGAVRPSRARASRTPAADALDARGPPAMTTTTRPRPSTRRRRRRRAIRRPTSASCSPTRSTPTCSARASAPKPHPSPPASSAGATASSSPTRASTPTCSSTTPRSPTPSSRRWPSTDAAPWRSKAQRGPSSSGAPIATRAGKARRCASPSASPARWPRCVLASQAAHHYRDTLAARWPSLRPPLAAWCNARAVPDRGAAPDRRRLVESTALTRAAAQDAFVLSVTLRSRSALTLAMPSIDLDLTDANGRLVARRASRRATSAPPRSIAPHAETAAAGAAQRGNGVGRRLHRRDLLSLNPSAAPPRHPGELHARPRLWIARLRQHRQFRRALRRSDPARTSCTS